MLFEEVIVIYRIIYLIKEFKFFFDTCSLVRELFFKIFETCALSILEIIYVDEKGVL